MKNAFLLGLENKDLEICNDLISLNEYKEYRSQSIFYLAEYFLYKAFNENDNIGFINKAYTFYSLYEKDYPNGEQIKIIHERKKFLENRFLTGIGFRVILDSLYNENIIVSKKLDFATELLKFSKPNIFDFFVKSNKEHFLFIPQFTDFLCL